MANQVVNGIVGTRSKAEKVVQALTEAGIPHQAISFLSQPSKEFPELERRPNLDRRTLTPIVIGEQKRDCQIIQPVQLQKKGIIPKE